MGDTCSTTCAAARRAVFEYIEAFYIRQRIHSTLNYRTPAAFESLDRSAAAAA